MNNNFDWTRFCKVVRKDFMNIWPRAGKLMLVLACVPVAVWLLAFPFASSGAEIVPEVRQGLIGFLAMFLCAMFPSVMYRSVNQPKQGQYYAMLPASHLEKYLSMLLHCIVIAPALFCLGVALCDMLLSLLPFGTFKSYLWQTQDYRSLLAYMPGELSFLSDFFLGGRFLVLVLLSFLSSQVVFIFTNTIFKSHKFIFTLLALWALNFGLSILEFPLLAVVRMNMNLEHWVARLEAYPEQFFNIVTWGATAWNVVWCAGLLVWTYFRLKKMKY